MAQDRFSLSKNDRRLVQETIRTVKAGKGSQRPVPTRRRNRVTGTAGNVIYAQVVGTVTSGDPTFTFDNAVAQVGSAPSGGTGTAQNQYAQEYADNDCVFLIQDKVSGVWRTERGGTSGSQIVYFEITENKVYGDNAVLAKPVLADDTMDSGADAFYVVDEKNLFYGRAAESGEDGYRGFGLRYTDDYSEGVPGFRIITLEGPAQFLIVTLDENLASPTDCSLAEDPAVFGLAFRGRLPAPVGAVDVQVYDDLGAASGAQSGEKWIVTWNEVDERYCFWRRINPPKPSILRRYEATSTISAATGLLAANWGSGTIQILADDGSNDGSPVTATNSYFDSFVNKSVGWCDISKTPPAIVTAGCTVGP